MKDPPKTPHWTGIPHFQLAGSEKAEQGRVVVISVSIIRHQTPQIAFAICFVHGLNGFKLARAAFIQLDEHNGVRKVEGTKGTTRSFQFVKESTDALVNNIRIVKGDAAILLDCRQTKSGVSYHSRIRVLAVHETKIGPASEAG